MTDLAPLTTASIHLEEQHPDLKLLVLFGSRARGDDAPSSDWDFAFLSDSVPDADKEPFWFPGSDLLVTLSDLLQISSEAIDLVNLDNCSDILAHFVARDGELVYERDSGEFSRFQQQILKSPAELRQFCQVQREKVLQALERWNV